MDEVRFGIIGCGNMGTGHAKNFLDGKITDARITAVCDINPKKFDFFKEKFGETINYYLDAEAMMRSGDVDCVMICTPHYIHPDLAILAMDVGVHCIVEKPAGVYTLQVKKMLERVKTANTIVGIMFNQRTNPAFKKMKAMIAEGKIGEIKRTNWIITDWYRTQYYYDSGAWRATWVGEGGGVLYNQSPHQLDLFSWIIGMQPSKVRAFCHFGKWHDIEVEDDVTCYCEYPNGATGVFITTTADAPGTNRFEVTGTKGTLIYERDSFTDANKLYYKELVVDEREHCYTSKTGFNKPECKPTVEIEIDSCNPQHVGICQNVTNAILGKEALYAPATDGLNGVELANAMLLSTWLDKDVSLPIDDELFWAELQKRIAVSVPREEPTEVKVEAQG